MNEIKLLELFSGIQSQEKALKAIGVPYESVGVCELDKDCLVSAAAMRFNIEEEIAKFDFPSKKNMILELQQKNIGWDFKKNCHTITNKTNIDKVKLYYICDKLLKNIGDISLVTQMPFSDLLTYSFPCTDLSVAGKGEGMINKCECGYSWPIDFSNSNKSLICPQCGKTVSTSTRSGLLGQVQRLLTIAYSKNALPKYLLLENVKNLVGKKFKPQFNTWISWLNSIGYTTYWKILNAKNYGIAQNRERIFAISIRKDIDDGTFQFPNPIPLTSRLKDVLCTNVPEKYYLPDERVQKIIDKLNELYPEPICVASRGRNPDNPSDRTAGAPTEQRLEPNTTGCTNTITSVAKDNWIAEPEFEKPIKIGQASSEGSQSGTVYSIDGVAPTLIAGTHGYAMGNIAEPQMLRAERTEYGKEIRKKYESGEVYEHIGNMREIMPRTDGISNTITTISKDTYVAEPQLKFIGGLGNKDWAKDGKQLSRNYPQGSRIYSADGIATSLTARGVGGAGGYSGLYAIDEPIIKITENIELPCSIQDKQMASTLRTSMYKQGVRNLEKNMMNNMGYEDVIEKEDIDIIKEDIILPVTVRKYEVDIPRLQNVLREHKCYSNKEIAETLNRPLTLVEHWFRRDKCFAIPDADIWMELKQLLNINTNEFDESIMTFETKNGVYDKSNRLYYVNGIAPTLTAASANEKILEPNKYVRWRIRKLMEKETWRLMGFTDEDYERAANYVVSSQIYKQAGNSICTCCLVSIFYSLFFGDSSTNWQKYLIHYDDKTE